MRHVYCGLVTIMVVLLGGACESEVKVEQSPLATWGPSDSDIFHDASAGRGTLDISADCVRLVLDKKKTILLVWPEPTSWNASSQTIEFVDVWGERAELRDGDRIIPGGATPRAYGDQVIPGGATPFAEPQFVSPPDPSCKADEMFMVSSLTLVTD